MIRLQKIKLKRLFVNDAGEYTDIPRPYDYVKDFLVNQYGFSSDDTWFRSFYTNKYLPIMQDKAYLNITKKFTLTSLFGISELMITKDAYRQRGYTEDEISAIEANIIKNRVDYIAKRCKTTPPVDEKDVKHLIYLNGEYICDPLPYETVSEYVTSYQNFNKDNDRWLHDFYETKYKKAIENYAYWEIRNERHFGIMFGVYSYSRLSEEYWVERGYTKEESASIISDMQSLTGKDSFIRRYGEDEGCERYGEYMKKHNQNISVSNKKAWKEGRGYPYSKTINPMTGKLYTISEGVALNHVNSQKGAHMAKLVRAERPTSVFQKQYWINLGLSGEEAVEQVRNRMAINSISYYVEKYGPDEGPEKYKERIEKYKSTCKSKSSEELEEWNKKKVLHIPHGVSMAATSFFDNLKKRIQDEGLSLTYMYGDKEYYIVDEEKNTIYFYDCYIKECNTVIEYNGIKFHPNPNKMTDAEIDSWQSLFYKIPGRVQLEKDTRKRSVAERKGYKYIVVWEDDNIEKVIDNIINELKDIFYAGQKCNH